MVNILTRAIMMSTPLLLGALVEVYAERTGMMICAIEGIFLIGAWGGFVGTYLSGSLLVGLLLAIALGGLMALLYAFVTVTLGQQQVVTGTAMNILAVGICSYFQRWCPHHPPADRHSAEAVHSYAEQDPLHRGDLLPAEYPHLHGLYPHPRVHLRAV